MKKHLSLKILNNIKNKFFLLIIPLVLISFSTFKAFALEDAIIAIVNDEVITLKDLKDYIHSTYVSLVADGIEGDELKRLMVELEMNGIERLIEDRLILSKANEMGLEVNEDLVDEKIEKIKERYGSEQNFLKALIDNGVTITDLRDKILHQLKIKFMVEHSVKSKINIHPREITKFYEDNMDTFQVKERVDVDSIYIAFNNNKEAALKKANAALDLLKKGYGFEDINKKYSDTPSIGILERGQLLAKIEDVIFNLNENELSPLVEVDSGVYIFHLKKKFPKQIASIDEVKDRIKNYLTNQKFKEKFKKWMDDLKSKAYIELKTK